MANGFPSASEQKYTRLNNLGGWLVFLISAYVYWRTIEPTASFWDCGEFIAIDYKLQIGHPPGAPFLELVAHLVSLLTFGDVHKVAPYINRLSATCSALTIMFLFWTITYFARKIVQKREVLNDTNLWLILGCGLVGSLAFTFTDSFWFSAVEGEVYAMSSCFTAMVFWCITKWERAENHAERWIILTFYLIGISIGVHLLCLLAVPAVVFVYYFKRYPDGIHVQWIAKILAPLSKNPRVQGAIVAGVIAIFLLGAIQSFIIPGIVQLAFYFEIFFINKMHLAFNSGTLIYALTMLVIIVAGLIITQRRNLPGWSMAILSFAMLLIGYSSFMILVERARAKTPMDENNPSNVVNLHAYLGREQYGDWPLIYGPYYNSPLDAKKPYTDGNPVYDLDKAAGKYVVVNDMKGQEPNYDSRFCTFFPRMWDGSENHAQGYRNWGGTDFTNIDYTDAQGKTQTMQKPTFIDNFRYFIRYQVNFMFWRYFMWNFCGRQNDYQGYDDADNLHGNWITGISVLDQLRYPQQNIPDDFKVSKGYNPMYGLPLLLGLIGLFYQYKRDKANTLVILVLFFFTGLAIILYLNQVPYQPRERDYSYVGAFYAFAIWIGLGVMGVYNFLSKVLTQVKPNRVLIAGIIISLIVPVVMAKAEWNDHDRSKRYTCRDMAIDYLESCAPNAILFVNGDNDTFPLWYAQEVEGIRTDVRVCNLNLLGSSWYIDQMKRKVYNSEPLPFSLTHDQYKDGTREYVPFYQMRRDTDYVDLKNMIDFVKSDSTTYFPTKRFELKVNKENVLKSGAVPPQLADSILPAIDWVMPGTYVGKNTLMVLDLLAHNDWKRPIYFAVTTGSSAYMGLDKYLQLEGMAYRLAPIKANSANSLQDTRVATGLMYKNVMNKFRWGNMSSKIYLDENIRDMASDFRIQIGMLADALIRENKKDSATRVLDKCVDSIPEETTPYGGPMVMITYDYYRCGKTYKADELAKKLFYRSENKLNYYNMLNAQSKDYYHETIEQSELILRRIFYLVETFKQDDLVKEFNTRIADLKQKGILQ